MDRDQSNTDLFSQKCCQSEDQKESCANGHKYQPKPDENESFFIDDINGQNAQSVFFLNCSGRTIFVEGTFGNLRENYSQWIRAVFMFKTGVVENVSAIGQKCSTKEEVNKVDLANNVDEIQ